MLFETGSARTIGTKIIKQSMLELVEGSVQSSLLTFFSVCNTYVALVKKRTRTRLQRHWHSVLLAWRLD